MWMLLCTYLFIYFYLYYLISSNWVSLISLSCWAGNSFLTDSVTEGLSTEGLMYFMFSLFSSVKSWWSLQSDMTQRSTHLEWTESLVTLSPFQSHLPFDPCSRLCLITYAVQSPSPYRGNPMAGSVILKSQWYSVSVTGEQLGNSSYIFTVIDLRHEVLFPVLQLITLPTLLCFF